MDATTPNTCVRRERINQGGYDSTGYYWGTGEPLYRVECEDTGDVHYYRADDREEAKSIHSRRFPEARYYR
jgi:hypothetical protein